MFTYARLLLHLLLWAITPLLPPATAFPTYFPPFSFTPHEIVDPANIASLDIALADPRKIFSPPIVLCKDPSFTTSCVFLSKSPPDTCVNVMWENPKNSWNIAMEVGSLKVGVNAACALYEGPACGGKFTTFNSTVSHETVPELKHAVVSLFCEPLDAFMAVDVAQEADAGNGGKIATSQLAMSSSRRKRHARTSPDNTPPQPYPEPQAGSSGPSLSPWKPSSNDLPHKSSDSNCGDGPNNADGCMGPGRVRAAEIDEE